MNFAPSGVQLTFEVTFDRNDLNVAMTARETTNGNNILVSGPAAMTVSEGNTYKGYFTPSAGKSYLIRKVVYTDNTFVAEDPNYGAGSESIQSGGVDLSYIVPAIALSNKKFVSVPNMSETLFDWFQTMVFTIIEKKVVFFQNEEVPTNYNFLGVWQPFTSSQLMLKPEGQRSWDWFTLHSTPNLPMKNDDVVGYNLRQYRVMKKTDYTEYGYIEYQLIEDYIGSGP